MTVPALFNIEVSRSEYSVLAAQTPSELALRNDMWNLQNENRYEDVARKVVGRQLSTARSRTTISACVEITPVEATDFWKKSQEPSPQNIASK